MALLQAWEQDCWQLQKVQLQKLLLAPSGHGLCEKTAAAVAATQHKAAFDDLCMRCILTFCTAVHLVVKHHTSAHNRYQQPEGYVRTDNATMMHSLFNAVWAQLDKPQQMMRTHPLYRAARACWASCFLMMQASFIQTD